MIFSNESEENLEKRTSHLSEREKTIKWNEFKFELYKLHVKLKKDRI